MLKAITESDVFQGLKLRWEALDAGRKRIVLIAGGVGVVLAASFVMTTISQDKPKRRANMPLAQQREETRFEPPVKKDQSVDAMVAKLTALQQQLAALDQNQRNSDSYQRESVAAIQDHIRALNDQSGGNQMVQEQLNALRARIDTISQLQGATPTKITPSLAAPLPPMPGGAAPAIGGNSSVSPSPIGPGALPTLSGTVSSPTTPPGGDGDAVAVKSEPSRQLRVVSGGGVVGSKDGKAGEQGGAIKVAKAGESPASTGGKPSTGSGSEPSKETFVRGASVNPDSGANASPYADSVVMGGRGGPGGVGGAGGRGGMGNNFGMGNDLYGGGQQFGGRGGTNARDQREMAMRPGEKRTYIPAGSMFSGVLLNGMDAPTSSAASKNPTPVIIRVKHAAILPNRASVDIRECFVVASGHGSLSSERAIMRVETISCVRNDGGVVESRMDGYIVDSDGKVGMRGTLVTKQGALIANAMVAGILGGLGQVLRPTPIPAVATGAVGAQQQFQTPDLNMAAQNGLMGGIANTTQQVSKFYMDLAKEMHPIIEIDAGRVATIVLVRGAALKI